MDPITLITTALAFGATEMSKPVLGEAGKGIFQSLKSKIVELINGDANTNLVLAEHAKDSEKNAASVRKELEAHGIDKNDDVIRLAQTLMKTKDPDGFAAGKYNITIQGYQDGNHNHQENTFYQ